MTWQDYQADGVEDDAAGMIDEEDSSLCDDVLGEVHDEDEEAV